MSQLDYYIDTGLPEPIMELMEFRDIGVQPLKLQIPKKFSKVSKKIGCGEAKVGHTRLKKPTNSE